jgi:hypothetical protein
MLFLFLFTFSIGLVSDGGIGAVGEGGLCSDVSAENASVWYTVGNSVFCFSLYHNLFPLLALFFGESRSVLLEHNLEEVERPLDLTPVFVSVSDEELFIPTDGASAYDPDNTISHFESTVLFCLRIALVNASGCA